MAVFYYSRKPLKMSATNVHFSYHSMGGLETQHYGRDTESKRGNSLPCGELHMGKVSFGITNALSVILEFGIDLMTAMKAGLGREVIRRIATGN